MTCSGSCWLDMVVGPCFAMRPRKIRERYLFFRDEWPFQDERILINHRILVFRLTMSGSGASFSWGAPEWSHGSLVQGERQILMCPGTRISWTGSNGEEGRPDPVRGQGDLLLIFYPPWYLPGPSRGGRHGHPESQLRQLRGYDTPNESGPGRFFGT